MVYRKYKLTKLQRHTLYIIMLVEYESKPHIFGDEGFCKLLQDITIEFAGTDPFWNLDIINFPELLRYKPVVSEHPTLSSYWFNNNEDGWKKRVKILNKCINETYSGI